MTEIGNLDYLYRLAGKTISFKDIDTDGDGVISEKEYNSMLEKLEADSVELSGSGNADKTATEEEAAIFEQVTLMESYINELKAQISIDFCGENSKYIADITTDLKDFLNEFKNNYSNDISGMAAAFKEALPAKYAELKAMYLAENADSLEANVPINTYQVDPEKFDTNVFVNTSINSLLINYKEQFKQEISTNLEQYGLSFEEIEKVFNNVYRYSIDNLPEDAITTSTDIYWPYEETTSINIEKFAEFFNKNMAEALEEINKSDKDFDILNIDTSTITGNYYEWFTTSYMNQDFVAPQVLESIKPDIKNEAEKMCNANGINFDNAKFEELLNKTATTSYYENVQEFLENFKEEFSSWVYSQIGSEVDKTEAVQDMQTMACTLDKDDIPSYINDSASPINELLSSEILKTIKQKISDKFEKYGLSFEEIEKVFNNVYRYSVDNLPEDAITISKDIYWPYKETTSINIEKFVEFFNKNMAEALEEMNKSDKDFDILNIDMSTINNIDSGFFTTYYMNENFVAPALLESIKPDIKNEAEKMCNANGINFDNAKFEELLEKAKKSNFNNIYEFLENFKEEFSSWVYSQTTE